MWFRLRYAKSMTAQNPQGGHIFGVNDSSWVVGEHMEGHAQGITEEALC